MGNNDQLLLTVLYWARSVCACRVGCGVIIGQGARAHILLVQYELLVMTGFSSITFQVALGVIKFPCGYRRTGDYRSSLILNHRNLDFLLKIGR